VLTDSVYVADLQQTAYWNIVLPPHFDSTATYPILYLLHGYGGDHNDWLADNSLKKALANLKLIVVLPAAGNHWYVNTAGGKMWQQWIAWQLPNRIENRFKIDTTRRAVAGLSMGGYGAIVLALKYPKRYYAVGSFSGALTIPGLFPILAKKSVYRWLLPSLTAAFGTPNSQICKENDPFILANTPAVTQFPAIFYFSCGLQDGFSDFIPRHRAFRDLLAGRQVKFQYAEKPGGHDWQFWSGEIQVFLKLLKINE
jgi:S-formylglutathione hydrolase FrmB